jgi:hypothetical protein
MAETARSFRLRHRPFLSALLPVVVVLLCSYPLLLISHAHEDAFPLDRAVMVYLFWGGWVAALTVAMASALKLRPVLLWIDGGGLHLRSDGLLGASTSTVPLDAVRQVRCVAGRDYDDDPVCDVVIDLGVGPSITVADKISRRAAQALAADLCRFLDKPRADER